MKSDADPREESITEALEQWRRAERTVAVIRRGRVAAEAAALAAAEAAEAALATAEAAKAALSSASLAEASAAKTAASARLVVQSTRADLAESATDIATADIHEAEARERYRRAAGKAESD